MTNPSQILREARHVVVQDYPRQEIPEALTRAGLEVTIYGGPNEADILALDLVDDAVVSRAVGHRPDTADLLYVYRPLSEIDAILTDARRMGVRTIWRHIDPEEDASTAAAWRVQVEAAGLKYLDRPDIAQAARELDHDTYRARNPN